MRFDIMSLVTKNETHLIDEIFEQTGSKINSLFRGKTYWLEAQSCDEGFETFSKNLLRDPVDQFILFKEKPLTEINFDYLVQVSFKPGVTDNRAKSTQAALQIKYKELSPRVATGDLYFIKSSLQYNDIEKVASTILANPLIQKVEVFKRRELKKTIPSPKEPHVLLDKKSPQVFDLNISDEKLEKLSKNHLWALSLEEMLQIKEHFLSSSTIKKRKEKSLPELPTDIELEILAQTWSEHCKHKIFNANIHYTEEAHVKNPLGEFKVKSIFSSFIKKVTRDIQKNTNKDWMISLFTDNAGIVRYDQNIDFCLKVETHNSPSALDPYGGALTGILGVNRDILGTGIGAKPIANTNVLCFAPTNYNNEIINKLPTKLKHPKSILRGVHRGIEDGGNKSGIPTVNGAIQFHDNYAGKPLVYCGTVGVMPQKIKGIETHLKRQRPQDFIVICGGSVGADGIHGATFSSLELDDNAPSTAVQIGDPLTQKRLTDFLLEARDKGLYNSITDNGAGGLSSSVGEMAELTNGARINIEAIPLKYPGLCAFEIVISESQERMTFSVPKESLEEFVTLASKRNCNPAVIGQFHEHGSFDIYENNKLLASLDMKFLHDSLAPMELKAEFRGSQNDLPWHMIKPIKKESTLNQDILTVIKHPNVKSKEPLIRQFDHEVKASTIIKPFIEKKLSGPSDAAVIWTALHGGAAHGAICVSSGLAPQASHIDTYIMTQMAIDEAVRNAVSCGANPDFISLCDNYCWPDPIPSKSNPDAKHKLAQLVRSGKALYDTALVYETPFISGKDSMKNDFIGQNNQGERIKISVPPTLLITALAKLDHMDHAMSTDFKEASDLVYYLGPFDFNKKYFSTFNPESLELPSLVLEKNKERFHLLHKLISTKTIKSSHDVSDGGIISSIIESSFPSQLGFEFNENFLHQDEDIEAFLFNELSGGFIISVSPGKKESLEKLIGSQRDSQLRLIGEVTLSEKIILKKKDSLSQEIDLDIHELYTLWSQDEY